MGWWYGADLKTGRCARGQPEAAVSVGLTPAGAPALTIGFMDIISKANLYSREQTMKGFIVRLPVID